MTKLKTLKDLKKYRRTGLKEGINVKEHRREAIKWVKDCRNSEGENYGKNADWVLMKKNNITEEDLK